MRFRVMFDLARASDLAATGAITVGDERFLIKVEDKCLRAERGTPDAPDFNVAAPVAAM
jgi:hypothetical protein